ncbi:hypothetical protein [Antarctobacter jejuensis]|uniref:hypothetical protein n=1 Tax=Antarctobacter jejuensis TaxID=1439938 RepID=UPI003FD13C5A
MTFDYPYAGLILPDVQDLDPAPYLTTAAEVLARLDPRAKPDSPTVETGGCVMGQTLGIAVIPDEESDFGPRVVLEVVTVDGMAADEDDAARLLSETVAAALNHSSADILEWYAPDVLLDREDFLRLRALVSPRRFNQMSSADEDALFESAEAAQNICDALYPEPVQPEIPAKLQEPLEAKPKPGVLAFLGGLGLRRVSQMAAVTSLLVVLTSTGHMHYVIDRFIP